MNVAPDKELFDEVALVKGIQGAFVEKDWFVTQLIASLCSLQLDNCELVFTGGTALSKAHHLLQRFSEDIDFRLVTHGEKLNRKTLSGIKDHIVEQIRATGYGIALSEDGIRARNENRYFSFQLTYLSSYAQEQALRAGIKLEVSVRDLQIAPVSCSVSSFVNEVTENPPEVEVINCIRIAESAADKLSALTWRVLDRVRGDQYDDPALIRHLHDLAVLAPLVLDKPDFAGLALKSLAEDNNRPKNNKDISLLPVEQKLKELVRILSEDRKYPSEYTQFVEGVSYAPHDEIPTFEEAKETLSHLIERILSEKK